MVQVFLIWIWVRQTEERVFVEEEHGCPGLFDKVRKEWRVARRESDHLTQD